MRSVKTFSKCMSFPQILGMHVFQLKQLQFLPKSPPEQTDPQPLGPALRLTGKPGTGTHSPGAEQVPDGRPPARFRGHHFPSLTTLVPPFLGMVRAEGHEGQCFLKMAQTRISCGSGGRECPKTCRVTSGNTTCTSCRHQRRSEGNQDTRPPHRRWVRVVKTIQTSPFSQELEAADLLELGPLLCSTGRAWGGGADQETETSTALICF